MKQLQYIQSYNANKDNHEWRAAYPGMVVAWGQFVHNVIIGWNDDRHIFIGRINNGEVEVRRVRAEDLGMRWV